MGELTVDFKSKNSTPEPLESPPPESPEPPEELLHKSTQADPFQRFPMVRSTQADPFHRFREATSAKADPVYRLILKKTPSF